MEDISSLKSLKCKGSGSLQPYIETFTATLFKKGYAISSISDKVNISAQFGRWIYQNNLSINNLNEQLISNFLKFLKRQETTCLFRRDRKALRELILHLAEIGIISGEHINNPNPLSAKLMKRRGGGTLQPYIETYTSALIKKGRPLSTIANIVSVCSQLGRWIDQNNLSINNLNEQMLDNYFAFRRQRGITIRSKRCKKALRGLLLHLKQAGVIPVVDIKSTNFLAELNMFERANGGSLRPYLETFASFLLDKEYALETVRAMVQFAARFSRWVDRNNLQINDLDEQTVNDFFACHRKQRLPSGGMKALHGLLQHLRECEIIPPKKIDNPFHFIENDFKHYLFQERGLSKSTVYSYIKYTHDFLMSHFSGKSPQLKYLCSCDISRFMVQCVENVGNDLAITMSRVLRGFLRFLHLRGETSTDLSVFVPIPKKWRLAELPKYIEPEEVELLLNNCDRSTVMGKRDYAILLLLARLGLRACEVRAMKLEDINWNTGEILIRGKGLKQDRLPLLHDVGEAIAVYLQHGRPRSSDRHVFLRIAPPHRGLRASGTISQIVRQAVENANLNPPRKGAHLLRHSLAYQMLREGASLSEIGEILRHNSTDTTEIYTKIDLKALRTLVHPWPGEKI